MKRKKIVMIWFTSINCDAKLSWEFICDPWFIIVFEIILDLFFAYYIPLSFYTLLRTQITFVLKWFTKISKWNTNIVINLFYSCCFNQDIGFFVAWYSHVMEFRKILNYRTLFADFCVNSLYFLLISRIQNLVTIFVFGVRLGLDLWRQNKVLREWI